MAARHLSIIGSVALRARAPPDEIAVRSDFFGGRPPNALGCGYE